MKPLLSVAEAAAVLNVSIKWIYDHANRRTPRLPCVRLGKSIRFEEEDIANFRKLCREDGSAKKA